MYHDDAGWIWNEDTLYLLHWESLSPVLLSLYPVQLPSKASISKRFAWMFRNKDEADVFIESLSILNNTAKTFHEIMQYAGSEGRHKMENECEMWIQNTENEMEI